MRDKSVIRGIVRRRIQYAVEYKKTRFFIEFVLLFTALLYFYYSDEFLGRNPPWVYIVA